MGASSARELEWHLTECPGCGATNAPNAEACWRCDRPVAAHDGDAAGSSSPPAVARATRAERRWAEPRPATARPHRSGAAIAAVCGALALGGAALAWWWYAGGRTSNAPDARAQARPAASSVRASPGRSASPAQTETLLQPLDKLRALGLVNDAPAAQPAASGAALADEREPGACPAGIDAMGLCDRASPPESKR